VSRFADGPQIEVEPIQNLADGVLDRRDMPTFEESVPFFQTPSVRNILTTYNRRSAL
jgi:hypothetical protein